MSELNNMQKEEQMKCILAKSHGENIDTLIFMSNSHPRPTRKDGEVLIKVKACALAPGDVRVLAGHCDLFQEPPCFPYIPGGDIAGEVVGVEEDDVVRGSSSSDAKVSRFKNGDKVIAMFELPRPLNGLAEFISVKEYLVEMAPKNATPIESAALTSSALSAFLAAKKYVKPGDRILVLGGSGGVGTFLIQLAKMKGASYIAATSSDQEFLISLGADKVINYQESNWWEDEELLTSDPFDLIVDLAVGHDAWMQAKKSHLLKSHKRGGKFLAFTSDKPLLEIHNLRQMMKTIGPMQWRTFKTKYWPFGPQYIWHGGLDVKPGLLAEVTHLFEDGSIKVVQDPISPLKFTEEDVKRGLCLMQKRCAHGKVVVSIS